MISLVVISVEGSLSDRKGSTNRDGITSILGCSGKKGVDVVLVGMTVLILGVD